MDEKLIAQVIAAESNFDAKAVSRKRALGLMQLLRETAAHYSVANVFDPAQNIDAGTHYLITGEKKFATNAAIAGMLTVMARTTITENGKTREKVTAFLVTPDLPGFGLTDVPSRGLTFDRIAKTIDRFTEVIGFDRYAVYVFDYGSPVGLRLDQAYGRATAFAATNKNAPTMEMISERCRTLA